MKVNISYAVELEDVPAETDKLLGECEDKFRKIHGALDQTSAEHPLQAIDEINNIRADLQTIDLRLADCSQILFGYIELLNKIKAPQDEQDLSEGESNGDKTSQ